MVEMVELEREVVQSLSAKDQVRMAMHALNGWAFSLRAAGTWMAQHRDYFDQYGTSLLSCLDRLERANPRPVYTNEGAR